MVWGFYAEVSSACSFGVHCTWNVHLNSVCNLLTGKECKWLIILAAPAKWLAGYSFITRVRVADGVMYTDCDHRLVVGLN